MYYFNSFRKPAIYHKIRKKKKQSKVKKGSYMLPDGTTIEIGKARFRAPEILFKPDLIGEECGGLHEVSL